MGACRGQKEALDLLELKLQVDVSHWPWVLGTELGFSGTAASIFNIAPSLQPPHSFLLTRSMTQAGLELDAAEAYLELLVFLSSPSTPPTDWDCHNAWLHKVLLSICPSHTSAPST